MVSVLEQTLYIVETPSGWKGDHFADVLKESADNLDIPVMVCRRAPEKHVLILYFFRRSEARNAFFDLIKKGKINAGTPCDMRVTTHNWES